MLSVYALQPAGAGLSAQASVSIELGCLIGSQSDVTVELSVY